MNDVKRSEQAISAFIFLSKYCETEKCEKCVFNTGGVGTKQEYGCGLVAALSDHRRFSTVLERAINRGSIMKCDRCNGQGFSVIAKWKCPVCDGKGVVEPLTDEEWLRGCTFEEMAGAIYEWYSLGYSMGKLGKKLNPITEVVEWLKEPYKE